MPCAHPHSVSPRSDLQNPTPSGPSSLLQRNKSTATATNPLQDSSPRTPKLCHPFLATQSSKPPWTPPSPIKTTQTRSPSWDVGSGATDSDASLRTPHREIDPFAPGRPWHHNYTLLISAIVPRPIGFVSTLSADGSTANLAPFSYFQVVDHDPPIFVLAFTGRAERPKDTLRNLTDTRECVINVVSEHFVEAMNACSIDAPRGVSEWELSGLHKAACSTVKPARVQEAVFSAECKLLKIVEFDATGPSRGPHGCLAVVEATRFWAREDAVDEKGSHIDLEVLRPVGQLGGMSYSRIGETFELPRTRWAEVEEWFGGKDSSREREAKASDGNNIGNASGSG